MDLIQLRQDRVRRITLSDSVEFIHQSFLLTQSDWSIQVQLFEVTEL